MLDLTENNRDIPFIITNSNWTQTNDGTQLIVTVKLQYPVYCSATCSDESITQLYTTLLSSSKIKDFTYTNGFMTYRISKLDLRGVGTSAPASLFILTYPIQNSANIIPGPITDEASLANIRKGIKESLNSPTDIDIIRASFVPAITSAGKAFSVQRRIRQQRQIKYILTVTIRFIVAFFTSTEPTTTQKPTTTAGRTQGTTAGTGVTIASTQGTTAGTGATTGSTQGTTAGTGATTGSTQRTTAGTGATTGSTQGTTAGTGATTGSTQGTTAGTGATTGSTHGTTAGTGATKNREG
ncbi:unnamed protein product, partial [Rotaria sp. Silwood1]